MERTSEKNDAVRYALIGGVLGAVFFLLLFGYKPLIVTNVAFLYDATDRICARSDVPYHQLALDYYLRSPWSFPPGSNPDYPHTIGSSVLLSDSLPLFAIVTKLFAGILPEYFQYFGIWTLLCFILQGALAALILRKTGIKLLPATCAVPLFILNVPLLYRCFHHCALCGQWLILLALLGYLYNAGMKFWKKYVFWIVVCVLCVLVQGYFLIMCGGIMTAALVCDVIADRKKTVQSILILVSAVVFSVLTYYLCGGFVTGGDLNGMGIGLFPFDVAFLVDPYIFSSLFSGNRVPDYNTEHDAYLGIALIILYLFALAVLLLKRKEASAFFKKISVKATVMMILLAGFTVVSFGTCIQFFGITIVDLREILSDKLQGYLSVFRSSARFFWPVWYAMLICVIRVIYSAFKEEKEMTLCIILLVCVMGQYVELPMRSIENRADNVVAGYTSSVEENFASCFNENAKHMALITGSLTVGVDVNVYAVHHGLTSNMSNLGRGKMSTILEDTEKVNAGGADRETVYFVRADEAGLVNFPALPEGFRLFYDEENYLCFFDEALLAAEPACMEIDLSEIR